MAKSIHDINLLPQKGTGFVDQFLSWSLNIGRLLIILTETLALSVFIYRFSLDMRIVDLHDAIDQQSAITKSFKGYEDSYRNLQERLVLADQYDKQGTIMPSVFGDIIELGRGKITFNTLLVSNNLIKIEAQAPSSQTLNTFINGLKNDPRIASVSIDSVENKTSDAIVQLSITARLKKNT